MWTGISRDRKSHSNAENILVVVHETICVALDDRVRAPKIVRPVFFSEWLPTNRMLLIILEKTPTSNVSKVNVKLFAQLC